MRLHLVRHGLPAIDSTRPANEWSLAEEAFADIEQLRTRTLLTGASVWYTSPEPKARATAAALTAHHVVVVGDLREAARTAGWYDEVTFDNAAARSFADPRTPGMAGWEPLNEVRLRVARAVEEIVDALYVHDPGAEPVLVGHGIAFTLLVSELAGRPPDVAAWRRLTLPDHCVVDLETSALVVAWGSHQSDPAGQP